VSPLPYLDLATEFRRARPVPEVLHLDSAAAGRSSTAVIDAVVGQLRREAVIGAYEAAAEAADAIAVTRAGIARLTGFAAAGVAFAHSASDALALLLSAWQRRAGRAGAPADAERGVVLVSRAEYGPNVSLLADAGWRVEVAPTAGPDGLVDPDALAARLASGGVGLVHLTVVPSHRGIVQPGDAVVAASRAAGVPCVLDVAQALGHVAVPAGADAAYGTSRKWVTGPRGVGFLAVGPALLPALRLAGAPVATAAALDRREAFVAGRVGLGVALAEFAALSQRVELDQWTPAAACRVRERLAALGAQTRGALDGVAGWEVCEPPGSPTAITTLRRAAGGDPATVVRAARLLREAGIVLTVAGPDRAPLMSVPTVLRIAPHLDVDDAGIDRLRTALAATG
jgi:pyridoxal 5-phosphate dependent beta-lyase